MIDGSLDFMRKNIPGVQATDKAQESKGSVTLRLIAPTYADVWKIQQVRWYTLSMLEISFKHVTNTLLYGGIRWHTAKWSNEFVHL